MFLSKEQNSCGATGSVAADKRANYIKFWLCASRGDRMMDGKASRILKNRLQAIELLEEKHSKEKLPYNEFE